MILSFILILAGGSTTPSSYLVCDFTCVATNNAIERHENKEKVISMEILLKKA